MCLKISKNQYALEQMQKTNFFIDIWNLEISKLSELDKSNNVTVIIFVTNEFF